MCRPNTEASTSFCKSQSTWHRGYRYRVFADAFFGLCSGKGGSAKAMAEAARPKAFYHGTQVPIHTLAEPYLDPRFARHQDEGDPEEPHVFVTSSRRQAVLFSLKVKEVIEIEAASDGGSIVYSCLPECLRGGWLYTCPEDPQRPFRQISVRGRRTDKWVSPRKVPVTRPVFIPGLEYLVRQGLKAYVLRPGLSPDTWSALHQSRRSAEQDLREFYDDHLAAGNLQLVDLK
jgi:hypothetical protein